MSITVSCRCPGNHDGDSIVLREKLSFDAGMALLVLTGQEAEDEIEAAAKGAKVATAMVVYGVESWNVVDETGQPVKPSPSTVRTWLGPDFDTDLLPLINAAFERYQGAVMRPLPMASSGSPADGPTGPSTSRSPKSQRTRPS